MMESTKADCLNDRVEFTCGKCRMRERVDYLGSSPPFAKHISLKYPSYVMKDPFSPPGKGEVLVLGSDCAICETPVCISKDCSVFYLKAYCLDCAVKLLDGFPPEVRGKITLVVKNK